MRKVFKWSEEKIAELEAEGCGRGEGASYKPWLGVRSFSSRGTSYRVKDPKTGQMHELLSKNEYHLYLILERQQDITGIRTQFPLPRELTMEVASDLQIKHPCFPGTQVPYVMTVDILADKLVGNSTCEIAYSVKAEDDLNDPVTINKLEIMREALRRGGIPHELILDTELPEVPVANLLWIRSALPRVTDPRSYESLLNEAADRLAWALAVEQSKSMPLNDYCSFFDAEHGLPPGMALRSARILMHRRELHVDLGIRNIDCAPLSAFTVAKSARFFDTAGS